MAKELTKGEKKAFTFLLIVLFGFAIFSIISEQFGYLASVIVIMGAIVVYMYVNRREKDPKKRQERLQKEEVKKRKTRLILKYKNRKVALRIINRELWKGETKEQLVDSLWKPNDIQTRIHEKKKEVWIYKNHNLKITLLDDKVESWEKGPWNNKFKVYNE